MSQTPQPCAAPADQEVANQVGQACLCFNLRKASRLVTQAFDRALKPAGLKVTQFSVLMGVRARPGARLGRLARALGLERTTLTRNLELLASRGLVTLAPGQDRREQTVSLTPRGAQALEAALPHWRQAQEQMVQLLGPQGMEGLLGQLRGLAARLG